jgi:hypothetical protein
MFDYRVPWVKCWFHVPGGREAARIRLLSVDCEGTRWGRGDERSVLVMAGMIHIGGIEKRYIRIVAHCHG